MKVTKEKKTRSCWPVYGIGVFWLLYALIFPMYRPVHFALLAVLSIPVYLLLSRVFPGKTVQTEVEVPDEPEPSPTGIPEHATLLAEGRTAVAEMQALQSRITDPEIRQKTERLIELTGQIFQDLIDDPADYRTIRRFSDYFLPTTVKMLHEYDRMSSIGVNGENIAATRERISEILDTTVAAYEKQLDALFANQALDIETDITVLENMLKKEGLASDGFEEASSGTPGTA